jgi:hypothetical protein
VLNAGAKFTLEADLDPPAPPSPVIGAGADASLVTSNLPGSITIEVTASTAHIAALSDFEATIYGSTVALKRKVQSVEYNTQLAAISVPCNVTGPPNFSFASVKSTLFRPSGMAQILLAGWVVPVAVTTPDRLGQAAGAGTAGLLLDPGASLAWVGVSSPAAAGFVLLAASPGQITLFAGLASGPETDIWQLWNGKLRPSTLEFTVPLGGVVLYISSAISTPSEVLIAGGSVVAHTDRPVEATGLRVALSMPTAVMFVIQTPAFPAGLLLVEGAGTLSPGAQPAAFALENAFIEALPPQLLIAGGSLQGNTVNRGALLLNFGLTAFVPMLPDPYATNATLIGNPPHPGNFSPQPATPAVIGALLAAVAWVSRDRPLLSFELIFGQSGVGNVNAPALAVAHVLL